MKTMRILHIIPRLRKGIILQFATKCFQKGYNTTTFLYICSVG